MKRAPEIDYPVWLSTEQTSRYLGVTGKTLHDVIIPAGLPVYRIGRVFRFKLDDVKACVESLRVEEGGQR